MIYFDMYHFCLGVLFLSVPAVYFPYTRIIMRKGILTDATVISAGRRGSRTLSYTVHGKVYEAVVSEQASTKKIGDTIQIYYHEKNPEKIVVKGGSRILLDLCLIVFVLLGLGLIADAFLDLGWFRNEA